MHYILIHIPNLWPIPPLEAAWVIIACQSWRDFSLLQHSPTLLIPRETATKSMGIYWSWWWYWADKFLSGVQCLIRARKREEEEDYDDDDDDDDDSVVGFVLCFFALVVLGKILNELMCFRMQSQELRSSCQIAILNLESRSTSATNQGVMIFRISWSWFHQRIAAIFREFCNVLGGICSKPNHGLCFVLWGLASCNVHSQHNVLHVALLIKFKNLPRKKKKKSTHPPPHIHHPMRAAFFKTTATPLISSAQCLLQKKFQENKMKASQKHEIMYGMQFAKLSEWHAQFVKLSLYLGYYQRIVQQKGIAVCEALKAWMMLPKSCTATKGHCSCEALCVCVCVCLSLSLSHSSLDIAKEFCKSYCQWITSIEVPQFCARNPMNAWHSACWHEEVDGRAHRSFYLVCKQNAHPMWQDHHQINHKNIANCGPSIDQQDDSLHW